jgi:HSP20 family molecular chaperone IbpA
MMFQKGPDNVNSVGRALHKGRDVGRRGRGKGRERLPASLQRRRPPSPPDLSPTTTARPRMIVVTAHPIETLVRDVFNLKPGASQTRKLRQPACAPAAVPHHRTWETAEAAFLEVELPGVAKEAIDLSVKNSKLRVAGARTSPHQGGNEGHSSGDHEGPPPAPKLAYAATFGLPSCSDVDNISAEHKDGVLHIRIPHNVPVTRQISIAL